MIFLKFFVGFLAVALVYVILRTIKLAMTESPNFPVEEEEEHLFAERPIVNSKVVELEMKQTKKVSKKDKVITHLMFNGTISKEDAQDLGVQRLSMHIHRLRQFYIIDNVIVNGKFVHYKLIELKKSK
jgi:hypothetical protein